MSVSDAIYEQAVARYEAAEAALAISRRDATSSADRSSAALIEWCEKNRYDAGDVSAPHVQAFLSGYGAGHDDGFDEGNDNATGDLRNGGTLR